MKRSQTRVTDKSVHLALWLRLKHEAFDFGFLLSFLAYLGKWLSKRERLNLQVWVCRRKNRLIESNVKCRYLKNFTCKGTLRQVFYLSEAPPSYDPIFPSPLTHCIRVYSILIHTGKGGRGELTREKVRGATVHKAGRKYQHDWLSLQPINSTKNQ